MNRKKILGIIFVIAALVCLHGFSTAMSREDGHTTKTMEQIEKAVFLQNGKVDKDNEGKPISDFSLCEIAWFIKLFFRWFTDLSGLFRRGSSYLRMVRWVSWIGCIYDKGQKGICL